MMNAFEHFLRNSQRDVPPLGAWTPLADHKHVGLIFEKFTNLISTQIPQLGDFRNGIVPFDVHRGLDLGWYGHCALLTPAGRKDRRIGSLASERAEQKNLLAFSRQSSYANVNIVQR